MLIGDKVEKLRAKAGLNYTELSEKAGISRNALRSILKNESSPGVNRLQDIVHACGSSLAEFFNSNIPDKYPDPDHHNLHESLQQMLDAGYYEKMEFFIEAVVQTAPVKPGHLLSGGNFGREGPLAKGTGRKKRGS